MKSPEKITEPLLRTIFRTVITTTIIAIILTLVHIFPAAGKGKLIQFEMIWLIVFCIVFGGHWPELWFINYMKFALPKNILLLYVLRVAYWFLCSIPLLLIANLIAGLFLKKNISLAHWYAFGLIYIGIQLFMHGIMQLRLNRSFYNGAY